jgi:hypothetical protein
VILRVRTTYLNRWMIWDFLFWSKNIFLNINLTSQSILSVLKIIQYHSSSIFHKNIDRYFLWVKSTANDMNISFNSSLRYETLLLNRYNFAWS